MKSSFRVAALALGCASLGACATVTRGANTAWSVTTTPAGASVKTTNGQACDFTPCSLQMSRKAKFTATITKQGYRPVSIDVTHSPSAGGGAAMAGNVIIGGLVGAGIDLATGAINDLTPNNLNLPLERDYSQTSVEDLAALSYSGAQRMTPTLVVDRSPGVHPSAAYDGRVVDVQVLPSGAVHEIRETP